MDESDSAETLCWRKRGHRHTLTGCCCCCCYQSNSCYTGSYNSNYCKRCPQWWRCNNVTSSRSFIQYTCYCVNNNTYIHTCRYRGSGCVFVLPHPESNSKHASVCVNMQHKGTTQLKHNGALHVQCASTNTDTHTPSLSRCYMVLQLFLPVCMFK